MNIVFFQLPILVNQGVTHSVMELVTPELTRMSTPNITGYNSHYYCNMFREVVSLVYK